MATWGPVVACLIVFLVSDALGLLLVVNRMARTEQAVIAVLQYVVTTHGDQVPPHVAALIPAIRKGAHRG